MRKETMPASSRIDPVRMSVRILVAVGALALAVASWHLLLTRQAGAVGVGSLLLILGILVGGFGALAILSTPSWPNAPVRVALAAAILLAAMTILSMPIPPRRETWGSLVLLGSVLTAGILVEALLATRPRLARWLLLYLGAAGCYLVFAASLYAMSSNLGGLVKESFGPLALLGSACFTAALHGRALWRGKSARLPREVQ